MSSNPPHVTVDCRGMQCPAPIISTAKAARELRDDGGLLQVMADDSAFPLDIKSWCRSSKAELVELQNIGNAFAAFIRIPRSKPALPTGPRPQDKKRPPQPILEKPSITRIDCMGMRCPQPILSIAKAAKAAAPGAEFVVTADDPAFAVDIKSWCRSAKANLLSLDDDGKTLSAHVRVAGKPEATESKRELPAPGKSPAAALEVSAAVEPASVQAVEIDLRPFEAHERLSGLIGALRAAPKADVARITVENLTVGKELLDWCAVETHELLSLSGSAPVTAEVAVNRSALGTASSLLATTNETTALVPIGQSETALAMAPTQDNRCSLLVLHNDHEALLAALLVANGAAAAGMDVSIFFTFWGLNLLRGDKPNPAMEKEKVTWVQRLFKWMMPKGTRNQKLGQMNFGGMGRGMLNAIMRSQKLMELPELVESAQDQGVRFIACTMSMSVMGITKRDLHPYANLDFGGVAAFVDDSRGASVNLVF